MSRSKKPRMKQGVVKSDREMLERKSRRKTKLVVGHKHETDKDPPHPLDWVGRLGD